LIVKLADFRYLLPESVHLGEDYLPLKQRSQPPAVETGRAQTVQNRHWPDPTPDHALSQQLLQRQDAVQIEVRRIEGPPRPPYQRHLDACRINTLNPEIYSIFGIPNRVPNGAPSQQPLHGRMLFREKVGEMKATTATTWGIIACAHTIITLTIKYISTEVCSSGLMRLCCTNQFSQQRGRAKLL
jgi:hypothetical protein